MSDRFDILKIEGYPESAGSYDRNQRSGARYGFDFWVVDTHRLGAEVKKFTGQGSTLADRKVRRAHERALQCAADLNERERIEDMRERHATD